MAVVTLTPKEINFEGVEAYSDTTDYAAPTSTDGYEFINDGKSIINIKNDSASALVCVLDQPQPCSDGGTSIHDVTITIPADDDFLIGPFAMHRFNSTSAGKVTISLDAFTDISACVYKLT